MIRRLAQFFTNLMQRWLPDALTFAVLLTFIVFIMGIVIEQKTALQMTGFWGNGLWNLLTFAMQMALVLMTGFALAQAKVIQKILTIIASYAHTPTQAVILTTSVSAIAMYINWGFGLVVGGLIAKQVASRSATFHYPLLLASAYSGFLVWHLGLSGSIPLKLASPANDQFSEIYQQTIPLTQTIFHWPVIIIVLVLLMSLLIVNSLMHPRADDEIISLPPTVSAKPSSVEPSKETLTFAQKLDHHPIPAWGIAALGSTYLLQQFQLGKGLSLNLMILIFLVLGLLFHGSLSSYARAIKQAAEGMSQLAIQFPLYAGLMGMISHSGLAQTISDFFIAIATPDSFLVWSFISAGIVNFFVPSGGGQWALQAPIMIPAAQALNISIADTAIAIALGDAWTNMIQPFWALPLIALSGLSIRHIMGYCTVILLTSGAIICLLLILLF